MDVSPAQQIKAWALEEGFTHAGIAALESSAHGHHLRRWIERGDYASMEWMARRTEVRENPALLLPGARSALCVTLQYWPLEGREEPNGDLWPRVARYARGRDYHDIMGRGLKRLAARIREAFDCDTRPYVDTGPILERELAARAGLGALAKNTHLLHRRWGTYFLLGEILLTLELEPESEREPSDLCGHCTRCLDACPTDALPEPYRLDSNRCISYWTIEHRGDIPRAMRPGLGEWVFGCDICQEVCPWNAKAGAGTEARLGLPVERAALDLAALLRLDRESYTARFIKSPMKRAKLEGLQRNAAVAMGNRGDAAYVSPLAEALAADSPVVRRHAAWALGRIADPRAKKALAVARGEERDPAVIREIEAALGG